MLKEFTEPFRSFGRTCQESSLVHNSLGKRGISHCGQLCSGAFALSDHFVKFIKIGIAIKLCNQFVRKGFRFWAFEQCWIMPAFFASATYLAVIASAC